MQFRLSFLQYAHLDTEISFNFIDYKFPNTNHRPFFDSTVEDLIRTRENTDKYFGKQIY